MTARAAPAGGASSRQRIGLLGGTFDPVHRGHLRLARVAAARFRLDWVYFLPARRPWHKAAPGVSYEDRFAMVALALAGQPRFQPLAVPSRGARPTYSVDEVAWVARRHPRARLYFLIGADAFAAIGTWKNYRRLLASVEFIVAPRAGFGLPDLAAALPPGLGARTAGGALRLAHGRAHWLAGFRAAGSSRQLRRLLAERHPAASRSVPARVLEYIERGSLYPAGGASISPRLGGDSSVPC
ncbi:MAG: nicotinate (nicotinamide) nucleotide adenylyltransferase [Terriglobales bacterium]